MKALPFFGGGTPPVNPNPSEDIFAISLILAEACGRGTLDGEGLRQLMELAPRIVTVIAKNTPETWAAATTARRWRNLMRMAEEGRLTTAVLQRALG